MLRLRKRILIRQWMGLVSMVDERWDGMEWNGIGWDGMGWDGMGWDGMGWMVWMVWMVWK
jgi:hypothetical protein